MQEGGTVDPVSGNDVPPGAMQEEVRDDIDAKLSEGEFVFPADVVRYIGLETLMRLRDKAKTGLKKMEEIGQMGNAEEVPNAEALHGEGEMDEESFSSEIDSIMSEEGEREYAEGGYVGGAENQQLYSNAPMKGFEMVAMTNDEGQVIYIPFINGVAQLTIPPGYKVKSAAPTTPKPVTPTPTTPAKATEPTGSDSGSSGTPSRSVDDVGLATASTISPTGVKVGAMGLSLLTGLPISLIANLVGVNKIADYMNTKSYESAVDYNLDKVAEQLGLPNTPENRAALSAVVDSLSATNPNTPAATPGVGGTGGAAAAAASAAAQAATTDGRSTAAIAAAAQAAADAVVSGKSATQAAQIAAEVAATVDGSTVGNTMTETQTQAGIQGTGGGPLSGPAWGGTPSTTPESNPNNTTESTPSNTPDSNPSTTTESTTSNTNSFESAYSYAQGGFVSKKKPTKASKPTSLVARRK